MRRARIAFLACVVALPAWAAEPRPEPDYFLAVKQAIERRDCTAAIDILWTQAKAGDEDARFYMLTTLSFMHASCHIDTDVQFRPDPDLISRFVRKILLHDLTKRVSFGPLGTLIVDEYRKSAAFLLKAMNADAAAADEVGACFLAGDDARRCAQRAVDLKIISPFADYAAELDRLIAAGKVKFTYRLPPDVARPPPPK